MNIKLTSVDQVRECLIHTLLSNLAGWVKKQREPFTIGDIYSDPEVGHDLIFHPEMIDALKNALARLNCVQVTNEMDIKFMPPVRLIDRDLLVS